MVSLKMARAKYGILLCLCVSTIAAPFYAELYNSTNTNRRSEDFYLRIMPLGASITKGDPTAPGTNGNGYRKLLRDELRWKGWEVNMVGSTPFGTMSDNDCEAYPGARVSEVIDNAKPALSDYQPNVILINAGTNDATQNYLVSTTSTRMETMIMECFNRVPNTVVVLSTLIPNTLAPDQVESINKQYRILAALLLSKGYHVVLAEMNDGFITLDDIWDGTHPYESGFQKMAAVWSYAIDEAESYGWLSAPNTDVSFSDAASGTTCPKVFGSGNSDSRAGMQILFASSALITDDGVYKHSSTAMGTIFDNSASKGADYGTGEYYLARLAGSSAGGAPRDDLVYVEGVATSTTLFVNQLDGTFGGPVKIDVHDGCKTEGIHCGDVNNDGLDDFICIGPEGNMYVSINLGGNPPQFKSLGITYKAHPSGYWQENVRLADIDGDGRLDYCVVADSGDVYCWRNGGLGDAPAYWQDLGKVSPGRNKGDITGVRYVDINGDGRSDWLWLDADGKVSTFINQRSDGDGLAPDWLDSGDTHAGMGEDTQGRGNILFGRIYGNNPDYVYVKRGTVTSSSSPVTLSAWKNQGSGGTHRKGDGAHWGDMDGNGNDDYVWISPDGNIIIFRNLNTPPDTSKFDGGSGWDAAKVNLVTGFERKAIHLGDWNGDGKADVIAVDKATGALTIWLTSYAGNNQFSFTQTTVPGTYCTQGWGSGLFDIGPRFADVTGEGKVDYLCMQPDGHTDAWLNTDTETLTYVGQIKYSENLDRANHKFADVNGDGKADFLWVDKFDGNAKVWYNAGIVEERVSGSLIRWNVQGTLYEGSSCGANMNYPNVGGLHRADQVEVSPTTAHGWIWYNTCPSGGDDGGVPPDNPQLPAYKPSGGSVSPNPGGVFDQHTSDPGCSLIYDCVSCDVPDNHRDTNDLRWTAADVDSFLKDANAWYLRVKDIDDGSSDDLGELRDHYDQAMIFKWGGENAPGSWDCEVLGESLCTSSQSCEDCTGRGGVGAMCLVMTSWSILHNYYTNMHDTVVVVQTDFLGGASDLVKNFSPSVDASGTPFDGILKVLGYFDDILGVAGANFWAKIITNPKTFENFSNAVTKASTYTSNVESLVTFTASYASDQIPALEQSIQKLNEFDRSLSELADAIRSTINSYTIHLFDGTEDGMAALAEATDGGFFLTDPLEDAGTSYKFQDDLNDAFYAKLIPIAWKLDPDVWPVLVYIDDLTTPVPEYAVPHNISFQHPLGGGRGDHSFSSEQMLSEDDANISRVLYGGTTLWLLDLHTCEKHSTIIEPISCTGQIFRALPGISDVNGDGTYGTVTKENMVSSSYDGWLKNFQQNGYQMPPTGNIGSVPFSSGFATAGFFGIPICDPSTAFANWAYYFGQNITAEACEFYPCCSDPYEQ